MTAPTTRSSPQHPLAGLRIVECASFVAGPSGCMTLGMLGADVIRVDPIEGAADHGRWPLSSRTGASLFWSSLNRGKKSVAVDLRNPVGRELVTDLVTAPGPDAGMVVDNGIGGTWLGYGSLIERRHDVIQIHIQGHSDGRPAVDYTVNPEVGVPFMTGPVDTADPVNHVVPAWDFLTGMTAATALLAALHRRARFGEGTYSAVSLSDVAMAGLGSMGWIAEAAERGDRAKAGNFLFGSFGVDFKTLDEERVMVVALTGRQWQSLLRATKTNEVISALEASLEADLSDEGERFRLREVVAAVMRPWFESRTLTQVATDLDADRVLWSQYRTLDDARKAYAADPAVTVLTEIDQPGIGLVSSTRSPIRINGEYSDPSPAPRLGDHTEEVLMDILGLTQHEVSRLLEGGVVGGPS